MFKKVMLSIFVMGLVCIFCPKLFAQTTTSNTPLQVYSDDLVSPLNFDVKMGETLNLDIQNKTFNEVTFEVPLMNVSVTIDKNSKAVVPVNFTNPSAKNVWFIVKQQGGNNKTGQFIVTDYAVKVPTSDVNSIDTSSLKDIINYSTAFTYDEKPEPVYSAPAPNASSYKPVETPIYTEPSSEPVAKPAAKPASGGYVRGYW